MPQRYVHASLAVVMALAMLSCATARSTPARTASPSGATAASQSFSLARIQRTGAISAWDAIRLLLPFHRFAYTATDGPRFQGSLRTAWESPTRLIIDGHRVDNANLLREIRADDLVAIHVLRGTDASARFGSAFNGGAIIIETRFAVR